MMIKEILLRSKVVNTHIEKVILNRLMPFSKRSQGHVEIIVSFIIFVGFIFFMFMILNPFATSPDQADKVLDNTVDKMIKEISEEVGRLSVVMEDSPTKCYHLNDVSSYGNKYIEINEILTPRKSTIYFSDKFVKDASHENSGCTKLFTLGVYTNDDIITSWGIEKFKDDYESFYDGVKDSMDITNDFLFEIRDFDDTIISSFSVGKLIPSGREVRANEIPIRVIDENGIFNEYKLKVMVW